MTFITGLCAAIFYLINTIFWVIPIVIFALLKLIPVAPWQRLISYIIDGCADCWVKVNGLNLALFSRTSIEVSNMPALSEKQWYMVISNHQSWVDIVVLQQIFNGKIPFLKFFLKQQFYIFFHYFHDIRNIITITIIFSIVVLFYIYRVFQ